MITVATCNHPLHAQLIKSVLEDSGIPTLIPNELSAQTMPHLILARGGIQVQVPAERANEARQIIAELAATSPESDQFPPAIS